MILKVGDICLFRNGTITKIIYDKAIGTWPLQTDYGVSVTRDGRCSNDIIIDNSYDIVKVITREKNPEYFLWLMQDLPL